MNLVPRSQGRSLRRLFVGLLALIVITIIHRSSYHSDPSAQRLLFPDPDGYTKAFVVASIQKDDTSWIREHLPDWAVFRYIVDNASSDLTVPKNKGREAMVYLTSVTHSSTGSHLTDSNHTGI